MHGSCTVPSSSSVSLPGYEKKMKQLISVNCSQTDILQAFYYNSPNVPMRNFWKKESFHLITNIFYDIVNHSTVKPWQLLMPQQKPLTVNGSTCCGSIYFDLSWNCVLPYSKLVYIDSNHQITYLMWKFSLQVVLKNINLLYNPHRGLCYGNQLSPRPQDLASLQNLNIHGLRKIFTDQQAWYWWKSSLEHGHIWSWIWRLLETLEGTVVLYP